MTKIILDYGFYPSDGDRGLALTDAQKALFPLSFIGSTEEIIATIGLEIPIDGYYYYDVILGNGFWNNGGGGGHNPNLADRHPWYSDYWLLGFRVLAKTPDINGWHGWAGDGIDVQFIGRTIEFWRDRIKTEELE